MSRRNQLNPMRFLVLLAVTWAAGTLLFAAEQTPRPTPAATAPAAAAPAADTAETPVDEPAGPPSAVAQAEPAVPAAEEQEAEEPKAQQSKTSPAKEKPAEESSAEEKSQTPQRASAADKGSPKRFVPSEQVRADFDVSFPIDI